LEVPANGDSHTWTPRSPIHTAVVRYVQIVAIDPREASSEKNWRLQAELEADLDGSDRARTLDRLLGSLRSPSELKRIEASVPHDVVITHDGKLLFAYAADEAAIQATRHAIEGVRDGDDLVVRSIRVSHWDGKLDDWRQIDPLPTTAQEKQVAEAAERNAETVETRTLVASAGNLVRVEFERSLREWAGELGVQCTVIDHPHLLSGQVAFTVTGPKRKVDEFADGLKAEERATIRTETAVMLSPL
jgi:acylphosphatase